MYICINYLILSDVFSEYLEEVCPGSDAEAEIQDIITRSFLDPNFHTRWKPYRIELVQNKHLEGELDGEWSGLLIHSILSPRRPWNFNFIQILESIVKISPSP